MPFFKVVQVSTRFMQVFSRLISFFISFHFSTKFKTQPQTLLHKNSWINLQCIRYFIVVTKQEILVISFIDFFAAVSRRHNDVILLPAIRRVSGNDFVPAGQCTGAPRRARATVELLRQETPNFLAPKVWPSNSPDFSAVDYEIWAVMQHCVYQRQIHNVDELNGGLSMAGAVLNSRFLTRLLTSGEEDMKRVSMLK